EKEGEKGASGNYASPGTPQGPAPGGGCGGRSTGFLCLSVIGKRTPFPADPGWYEGALERREGGQDRQDPRICCGFRGHAPSAGRRQRTVYGEEAGHPRCLGDSSGRIAARWRSSGAGSDGSGKETDES